MTTTVNTVNEPLPREMQQHTYAIMRRVEESHWWFVGRRKIIRSFVERVVHDLKTTRAARETGTTEQPGRAVHGEALKILDVGCGTGANLEMLSEFGVAEGVDVSAEALSFCKARGLVNVKLGEAERLPYAAGSFDLVTGLDVVEHMDDDRAGLREMARVLLPEGRALLFVPAFMFLWGVQDDISHHRRRYTVKELRTRLAEAGLTVERATYANITFFMPILIGRVIMRLTGVRPASENNITIGALNGLLGWILGSERWWLRWLNFPFGVSIICVARRDRVE